MAYRKSALGILVGSPDPKHQAQAKQEILAALRASKGNIWEAARELEVHNRTLNRWVVQFELQDKIEKLRGRD
jgi:transposase-like protein